MKLGKKDLIATLLIAVVVVETVNAALIAAILWLSWPSKQMLGA